MPFSILVESFREYSERHGNRPLRCGSVLMFFDGASCTPDGEGRQEPPTHPVENLRCRLQYWHQAVKRSSADFAALKSELARSAELCMRYQNLPGPGNQALADLHRLQAAVGFCRAEVAKLESELAAKAVNHPDHLRRQAVERYERQQQSAAAAVLSEIASVTI